MKDKRITDLPADHGIKVGDAAIAFNEMERKLAEPKTITVKSHTRRIGRRPASTPVPATDYDRIKLMVLATEFLDRANTAVERAQRFTMALDCVTAAYGIARAARGL